MLTSHRLYALLIVTLSCTHLYSMHQQQQCQKKKRSENNSTANVAWMNDTETPSKPLPLPPQNASLSIDLSKLTYDTQCDPTYNPPLLSRVYNYNVDKKSEINSSFNTEGKLIVTPAVAQSLYWVRHFLEAIKEAKAKNDQSFLNSLPKFILNNQIIPTTHKELITTLHELAKDEKQLLIKEGLIQHFTKFSKEYTEQYKQTETTYDEQIAEQRKILSATIEQINKYIETLTLEKATKLGDIQNKAHIDTYKTFNTVCHNITEWVTIQKLAHTIANKNAYNIDESDNDENKYTAQALMGKIPDEYLRTFVKTQPALQE